MAHRTGTLATFSATAAAAVASLAMAQANDNCSSPDPISGFGTFNTSTVGATTDGPTDSVCNFFSSNQIWNDVWMCWTADQTGLVNVETCGTGFDTKLAVYLGCGCPGADSALACNDDACSLQSRVTFAATAGQQYLIRVGSYDTDGVGAPTGAVTLTVGDGALGSFVNPDNGHTYIAYAATGWNNAEAIAQTLGTHLVSIDSAAENEWIRQNFGTLLGVDRRIWIGFNDATNEGDWVWADGSPVVFTNWNGGEPNNSGGVEDWAEFLGSNGLWNDINETGGSFAHIGLVEMGASTPTCPEDLDGSGTVDGTDLGLLLGDWGVFGSVADLDGNGTVDGTDLGLLLGHWGPCQ